MEFRRSGQREERRRRVRLDERTGFGEAPKSTVSSCPGEGDPAAPRLAGKTYHDAACADQQWRITDLIPTRFSTLLVLMLVGTAGIVGIESLYGQYEAWGQVLGKANVAALDPTGPASLAGWFSGLLLAVCSGAALMIYSIRRHKEDDYRGRYRIWVWAAAVWLLGSMAAVAPLHPLVAALIVHLSGSQLTGNPVVFSSSFYAMILITVAVPVTVDMSQSRLALTAMCAAGLTYVIGLVIDLEFLAPLAGSLQTMCLSSARMASHLLLLLSLLFFARHVYLDAQGMIAATRPAKERRPRRTWGRWKAKQPVLRIVADDLGETVTEAPEPEVTRKKTISTPAEEDEATTTRKPSKRTARASTISLASHVKESTREEPETPRVVKVPSISRQRSVEPPDEESEELSRLEATEPDQLTKAQRRRLRKLQRRDGRQAA